MLPSREDRPDVDLHVGEGSSWSPAISRWRAYRSEFEACKRFLGELACAHVVVAMGNHDARNVGYRHSEDCFGARDSARIVPVGDGRAKVVAIGSTKPDLDEGEVGREHYGWLDAEFRGWTQGPPDRSHPPSHPGRPRYRP